MSSAYTTDDKGFVPLAAKIKATRKIETLTVDPKEFDVDALFVLSPKAALEIQKLSKKSVGEPVSTTDFRLPYDSVIVELPITPEVAAMRYAVAGVAKGNIRRIAARIKKVNTHKGVAFEFWPFWEFENGTVGAAAVMANVSADTAHSEAMLAPSPMLKSVVEFLVRVQGLSDRQAAAAAIDMIESNPQLQNEVLEEISPLMVVWGTVVNCKSGVTRTHIGAKKGVSSMLGRKKKIMANTEYTVISLSAVETVSQGVTSQRADVEAHLVRGHFKRRKNGVYWWSPFIRGTGELKNRKGYILEGVPA
jgi:hypothetical protein